MRRARVLILTVCMLAVTVSSAHTASTSSTLRASLIEVLQLLDQAQKSLADLPTELTALRDRSVELSESLEALSTRLSGLQTELTGLSAQQRTSVLSLRKSIDALSESSELYRTATGAEVEALRDELKAARLRLWLTIGGVVVAVAVVAVLAVVL